MFFDLAIGIFCAIGISLFIGESLTATFLVMALLFSLIPDVDFLYHYWKQPDKIGEQGYTHRDLIHLPLLFIPLGSLVVFGMLGGAYAVLFALVTFFHFVHDSIGIGRGVKWLYPFSNTSYAFIYLYAKGVPRGLWKPIFSFRTKEDFENFDIKYADEQWFKNIYLSFHPYGLGEIMVFIVALIALNIVMV